MSGRSARVARLSEDLPINPGGDNLQAERGNFGLRPELQVSRRSAGLPSAGLSSPTGSERAAADAVPREARRP